jgi:uncharacterized damage-inducible protein DinB
MTSIQLITRLTDDVSAIITTIENEFLNLPDDALNKKESPVKWSILECIEHLNRYNRFYNVAIAGKLLPGPAKIDVQVKTTWIGKKSIQAMHPNNLKQQKTLKHLNPIHSQVSRSAMDEFLQHQRDLLVLLKKAESVNINTVRIPIEFFRLLKMNLGDAFQFVIVHQQRHMDQLNRILSKINRTEEIFLKV